MTASRDRARWEQTLVRHVVAAKRTDPDALGGVVRVPFSDGRLDVFQSGWQSLAILGRPGRRRWTIGARFAKQSWVPLFSNTSTAADLFAANTGSSRLEVALIGCEPEGVGWFFRLHRAGTPVVDFMQSVNSGSPPMLRTSEVERDALEGCTNGEQVFARLCARYDISLPIPQIWATDTNSKSLAAVEGR